MFYHVTTSKAAASIEKTQFRPGERGYAGAAIYFSLDPENAIQHCFNGCANKKAQVVICCRVDLGKCLVAKKKKVEKDECLARGYDSVNIKKTDTYAVYDPSRISIKEFRRIADDVCWCPSPSVDPSADALKAMIAAIKASPNGAFNTSHMGELYSKHPNLRQDLRDAGGMENFCEAHAELTMDGYFVRMAKVVEATRKPTPPFKTQMCRFHSIGNCSKGDSCSYAHSADELNTTPASTTSEEDSSSNVESASTQSEEECVIKPLSLASLLSVSSKASALEILVAAIQASPNGSLNVTSDISQLCLKHPDLHEALLAAGRLRGFCEAHAELAIDGSRVVLSKQSGRSQQLEMKREAEAPQMHPKRQAIQEVGGNITVRKLSSMGCAVISFRDPRVRAAILQALGERATVAGIPMQLKPGFDKETKEERPADIFVAWGHQVEKANPMPERELMKFFEARHNEHDGEKAAAEAKARREEQARQAKLIEEHAKIRRQAEEERQEKRLKQETARQAKQQRKESARQREADRCQQQRAKEMRAKEVLEQRRQAQELQLKNEEALRQQVQTRLKQEREAGQRRHQEDISRCQKQMRLRLEAQDLEDENEHRRQMWEARQSEQLRLEREKDARRQQELQLQALCLTPWDALRCIIGGIATQFGHLLGVQSSEE